MEMYCIFVFVFVLVFVFVFVLVFVFVFVSVFDLKISQVAGVLTRYTEEGAKVGLDGDVLRADYFKVVTPFIASALEPPSIVSKRVRPENQRSSPKNIFRQVRRLVRKQIFSKAYVC